MANSLLTAVSGLIAHQRKLDIVANNLANLNTAGYKSQRVVFTDLMYELVTPATSGNGVNVGGTNAIQIGTGVRVGEVDRKFSQGSFEATGQSLDFALEGDGFFVAKSGEQTLYSRAGAFALDDQGYLVDPATGYRVQRFGSVGEPAADKIGFQTPGSDSIWVPLGKTILGQPSSHIGFTGVLNSAASGPKAAVLTTTLPFESGGNPATATTALNSLDSNAVPYQTGDVIHITGTDADGTTFAVDVNADDTTTLGDLVNAINANVTQSTAAIDASGNITLTANNTGVSMLSLVIADDSANVGQTSFYNHGFVTTVTGKDGDVLRGSMNIYDVRGEAHDLFYTFQKTGNSTWDLSFDMDAADGTVLSGPIQGIQFNDDGTLVGINGIPNLGADLKVRFNGIVQPQTVTVSLTEMNHIATEFSMSTTQDGLAPSKLSTVRVNGSGVLQGISTTGQSFDIAQLAIALFKNPQGLTGVGQSYFDASLSSGDVELGAGGSGGRGIIRGGQLEGSNVDVAFEFTQLIVAQRGFSANARTITVANQVLEELTNIIR